jgi:hypothetical protein
VLLEIEELLNEPTKTRAEVDLGMAGYFLKQFF